MSAAPKHRGGGESDAVVRRARYTVSSLVLVAAATVACVAMGTISARISARLDLTATRDHTLSPRTVKILEHVSEPTTIVVSADASRTEPGARQSVSDLLSEFSQRSSNISVVNIDTSSPAAGGQADSVVRALAIRDSAIIERHRETIARVEADIGEITPALLLLADRVSQHATTLEAGEPKEAVERQATALRVASKDLAACTEPLKAAREKGPAVGDGDTAMRLPETDTAQQVAARPLQNAAQAIAATAPLPETVTVGMPVLRDRIAGAADRLASLRPLEPLSIFRMLRAQQAVLVFSDKGTTAIDFDAMFPRASAPGRSDAPASPVFAGEELLGTAVASLSVTSRPILVLVHAERERLLEESGRPTPSTMNAIGKLAERLSLRKIDLAEWPVAMDPVRPVLSRLDPGNNRPKVWFVLPAPARVNMDPKKGQSLADRSQRVARLGDTAKALLEAGDPVLLTLEPSEMPAVGEPDPVAAALEPWGLRADTGRPLLSKVGTPAGPAISAYQSLSAGGSDSPIAQAVRGLTTMLHWPMSIAVSPVAGVRQSPLLSVESSGATWGESSWLPLRYANVRSPFQALAPPDMPSPDPQRDNVNGPFVVAVAADRDRSGSAPQRLVVVAAPGWFEDLYTQASGTVDGRKVWAFPGNVELFEAAFHWLAGLDELIAPSPRIRDVPRIEPMSAGGLTLIRWTLIAGLPLSVLALGLAVRVFRG